MMASTETTIAQLRADLEQANERCQQLENAIWGLRRKGEALRMGLTPRECDIWRLLCRNHFVSRGLIRLVVYADRADGGPDRGGIDVLIFKLRRKINPFGYVIETMHGHGWRLVRPTTTPEMTDG